MPVSARDTLERVDSIAEIRENIREFNRDLEFNRERARSIAALTQYWVYDPESKSFGPGKFLGYRRMTYARYDRAHQVGSAGVKFDGTITQTRIAKLAGQFAENATIEGRLRRWLIGLFGASDVERWKKTKWRFVSLTGQSAGESNDHSIDEAGSKEATKCLRGQGWGLTKEQKDAVEDRAMDVAWAYFENELGYDVYDRSKTHSYDLLCRRDAEELYVEVKGTTGSGDSFFISRNEVELSRAGPDSMALAFVRNIRLTKSATPKASGGEIEVLRPWNVDEVAALTPLQYECRLLK